MTLERVLLQIPVSPQDHSLGPANAGVVIVEYGDYQCPFTAKRQPLVAQLMWRYPHDLKLVYRHFPIRQLHPLAQQASEAAEAAAEQGRFWEMHDAILSRWDCLDASAFEQFALGMGLNKEHFRSDLRERKLAQRVAEGFRGGLRSGVDSTPTFFINGVRYDGLMELPALEHAIRLGIAQKNRLVSEAG